jgi:hypothetical protein
MLVTVDAAKPEGKMSVLFAKFCGGVPTAQGVPAGRVRTEREQRVSDQIRIVDLKLARGNSVKEQLLDQPGPFMADVQDYLLLRMGKGRDLVVGNLGGIGLDCVEFGESFNNGDQSLRWTRCGVNRPVDQVQTDLVGSKTDREEHVLF